MFKRVMKSHQGEYIELKIDKKIKNELIYE
jgi:hypothetical protein